MHGHNIVHRLPFCPYVREFGNKTIIIGTDLCSGASIHACTGYCSVYSDDELVTILMYKVIIITLQSIKLVTKQMNTKNCIHHGYAYICNNSNKYISYIKVTLKDMYYLFNVNFKAKICI